jgi:striatin 1/3/4
MRFLQTEWHRHERDRNGWEIERQEMKGRIAKLEGTTRKSDYSNKSLKKYVNMLEKALKERDSQVKALKAGKDVAVEQVKEEEGLLGKKLNARRMLRKRLPLVLLLTIK